MYASTCSALRLDTDGRHWPTLRRVASSPPSACLVRRPRSAPASWPTRSPTTSAMRSTPTTCSAPVAAEVVPETVNLVITAEDPDPVIARDIAQAYAEALSDLVAHDRDARGRASRADQGVRGRQRRRSPTSRSAPAVRNLGLGLVLGLLLGVGIAVLRELLDTTISTHEDVGQVTRRSRSWAHINADPAAAKKRSRLALAEATPWAEAFRVLRTNMQYVDVDHDRRVFVVSSSLPGRGQVDDVGQPRGHPGHGRPERGPGRVRPAHADRSPSGSGSTTRSAPPACSSAARRSTTRSRSYASTGLYGAHLRPDARRTRPSCSSRTRWRC